jgi:hypothetical protein
MPTAVWTAIISGVVALATGSGWIKWSIEKPRTSYISIGSDRPPVRGMLAGEVDRIERQWGLRP